LTVTGSTVAEELGTSADETAAIIVSNRANAVGLNDRVRFFISLFPFFSFSPYKGKKFGAFQEN
jgi:hypothetical protein